MLLYNLDFEEILTIAISTYAISRPPIKPSSYEVLVSSACVRESGEMNQRKY